MTPSLALIEKINGGQYDKKFELLYGEDIAAQRERYIGAVKGFVETFGEPATDLLLFSAPGRTEIGGNHTDHNHGRVLAGSVNLDVIAVVAVSAENRILVKSQGYPLDTVVLDELTPKQEELNRSAALIRGTAARFAELNYSIGGFDAYTTSNVLKGSGLSSSAAFEVLVGVILNELYNASVVSAVEIAKIAQFAERVFFGKPCGLMDQMASSVGNIITIDFESTEEPVIEKVDFDFAKTGHALCIVDVGGNHADLTHEYAAVPGEMKKIAEAMGVSFLREITLEQLLPRIAALREQHGDRAVLRAIHFLKDNDRVVDEVNALKAGDFETFKKLVIASGNSSFEYLQNVYASCNVDEQGMSLALALAQHVLDGKGAWRVHGGGFGGTTQNFVPNDLLPAFREVIEGVFGEGTCHVLHIRPLGGVCVDNI
ncbi:MAG: galactokinase [Clostridia bacterium]|nr:galactokinase [Clostridia bacterium]